MNNVIGKKIVATFLTQFNDGNVSGTLGVLNDATIWQVMGREGGLPLSGKMYKADIADLMNTVKNVFPDGMTLTPTGWTSEGNRVAVEIESYGEKVNGTVYNNCYHFLFELADNKITSIREYMDTLHVKSVFLND